MTGQRRSGRQTLIDIFTLARDSSLAPGPKALWIIYRSYDSKGKGAWPGDELVAEHLGVSPRTVQRWREDLTKEPEKPYLIQTLDGPNPARYHAVLPERDDSGNESSDDQDTTPESDQEAERHDSDVESVNDDATEDATNDASQDRTEVAPHSTDEYGRVRTSTSDTSSLRSEASGDRERSPHDKTEHENEPHSCPTCGEWKPASYRACFACLRAEAGFPAVAFQGDAERQPRIANPNHEPDAGLDYDADERSGMRMGT